MTIEWIEGFDIKTVAEKGEILISVNREGLILLVKQLTFCGFIFRDAGLGESRTYHIRSRDDFYGRIYCRGH